MTYDEMMSKEKLFGPRRGWVARVNIKQFLSDDDSDENAVATADKVLRELESSTLFIGVMLSEAARHEFEMVQALFSRVTDCDEFNAALNVLYDFGDEHRVWID